MDLELLQQLESSLTPEQLDLWRKVFEPEETKALIKPQPGPQTAFFECKADIAVYGGAGGAGKTFALTVEPLRHISNGEFGCVAFRRTYKQISNEGSIWDESEKWYPKVGGKPSKSEFYWTFPSGARISFRHMEHEKDLDDYMSAQIALLIIDQVEQFEEKMVWGLIGRNRSTCGIKPYCRFGCNPKPGSWLADLLSWWIDQETGFALLERSGVLRYFARIGNAIEWADSKNDLCARFPNEGLNPETDILSLTFIPGNVEDNKILLARDPGYIGKLKALPYVERMQLLHGNWRVTVADGLFNTEKLSIIDVMPANPTRLIYIDKASVSEIIKKNKPSWTVMVLMAKAGRWYIIEDVVMMQRQHTERNIAIKTFVSMINQEYGYVPVHLEVEPGSGGKESGAISVEELAGFDVRLDKVTGDKIDRAMPFAAQIEAGNVVLFRGAWNKTYIDSLSVAPNGTMRDLWDCSAGAFNKLCLVGGGTGGQSIIYTGNPETDGVIASIPKDAWR